MRAFGDFWHVGGTGVASDVVSAYPYVTYLCNDEPRDWVLNVEAGWTKKCHLIASGVLLLGAVTGRLSRRELGVP